MMTKMLGFFMAKNHHTHYLIYFSPPKPLEGSTVLLPISENEA